jgi:hypothetical protein
VKNIANAIDKIDKFVIELDHDGIEKSKKRGTKSRKSGKSGRSFKSRRSAGGMSVKSGQSLASKFN